MAFVVRRSERIWEDPDLQLPILEENEVSSNLELKNELRAKENKISELLLIAEEKKRMEQTLEAKERKVAELQLAAQEKEKLRMALSEAQKKIAALNQMVLNDGKNQNNKNAVLKNGMSERPKTLVAINESRCEFLLIAQTFIGLSGKYKDSIQILEILRNEDNPTHQIHLKVKEKVNTELKTHNDNQIMRMLWHGSSKDAINSICVSGFNRSFAGATASRYGEGNYFAVNPAYCIENGFSHPDGKGVYHIILAQVVTGRSCQGEPGQRVLPLGFHSAVDNLSSPNMYIVYPDWAAYPDYVIAFRLIK